MSAIVKRLRMFAGPNGSGKTTLVRNLGKEFAPDGLFQLHHYINADDLYHAILDGQSISLANFGLTCTTDQLQGALQAGGRLPAHHPVLKSAQIIGRQLTVPAAACDGYAAAAIADFLRDQLLAAEQSFSFETVMSHPSKVDFLARARHAGYRTYLYLIATESPLVNVNRVENRSALGGHAVPASKIIERYERCLQLAPAALSHAYRAFIFDNSGIEPMWLAVQTPEGRLELKMQVPQLPAWFKTWLLPHIPSWP